MTALSFFAPRRAACAALLAGGVCASAHAQLPPSEPLAFADGRVTLGGDASVTFGCGLLEPSSTSGCADDIGFFNYTDYQHSTLRMLRLDLNAAVRAGGHLSVLGELRSENGGAPHPYALYVRIRPWEKQNLDVQVGLVPPTFGAFARRAYPTDNVLIGYPLAYQYLTVIRADALPADADELLRMRGRGWLTTYTLGNPVPYHGLPIASAFRWDTGVQVHAASTWVDATASVTAGSLGNPLFTDDNAGKQIAGRIVVRPRPGLLVGASATHGPFLSREASRSVAPADSNGGFTQVAWGADAEYSRDYYLIRFETIVSSWTLPIAGAPAIDRPLRSAATWIEGRYKIHPRLYAAGRVEHLGFSTITGTDHADTWDAPVSRVEVGGGFRVQRNLELKLSLQHNVRDGGRVREANLAAAQVVYWF